MLADRICAPALARPLASALLLAACCLADAQPPQEASARMVAVAGKDVSGTIYKKLGLPSLKYCWETCAKEERCTGARWGVIEGDEAGLCLLISGPLTFKALTVPKTDDGRNIRVIVGRKQPSGPDAGA